MADVELRGLRLPVQESLWTELVRKEDWWAVWISLALIGVAIAKFATGGSLQWIAVAPQKWNDVAELAVQLRPQGIRYLALGLLWAVLFGTGAAALGLKFSKFLLAFIPLFVAAAAIYGLGLWSQAAHYNLEPPLVALGLGLLVSNTVGAPRWLDPGLRVEFYIKTGIVLLGASLPLTLLAWAGPVAMRAGRDRSAGHSSASSISARCGSGWIGVSLQPWAPAAPSAAYPAPSPSAVRWAPRSKTFQSQFRWWCSGPSS